MPIPLLRAAEKHRLEGVVSKRRSAPYCSGECRDWRKVKTAAGVKRTGSGGGSSNVASGGERPQSGTHQGLSGECAREPCNHKPPGPRDSASQSLIKDESGQRSLTAARLLSAIKET
jgi:hypothetical protein